MRFVVGEINRDFPACGHVAQRVAVFAQDLEMQAFGASGGFTVNLRLEEREQFGAAFRGPRRGVGHLRAVGAGQRIGQDVVRDQ